MPGIPPDDAATGRAYAVLRAGGLRLARSWGRAPSPFDAVLAAIQAARSAVPTERIDALDAVELCVPGGFRDLDLRRERGRIANVHRGVRGIQLRHGGREELHAPTEMLARNLSFDRVLELFGDNAGLEPQRLQTDVQARTFDAAQALIQLKPVVRIVRLTRGTQLVRPQDVSAENVAAFSRGMADWMLANVRHDGRMTYKYWPSRGVESRANNMIRQWMATRCLARLLGAKDSPSVATIAERNLEYNLAASYREEGDLGLIDCDGKVKLGAIALAALAIVEHPERGRFGAVERALVRAVDHLWHQDGSFTTFHRPEGRNQFQNFYPGEALLLWSSLYTESRDSRLIERIMASFRHYRAWHRARRNPAFVPWHTQAYCSLWRTTKDPELREFVFEMNDWLLQMQQWDDAAYPEMRGQFYDPAHPEYGPPHASSTGAYLEGLIEAHRLARDVGDQGRAEAYRLAIARGLRSVMQLQFADSVDMFYVSKRDRVRGGLRTTVYDNTIRVDNVQHNLMAALRIMDSFSADDYRCGGP